MATCSKCDKNGFSLKLDVRGLCPDCQNKRNKELSQQLNALQDFYDKWVVIPNAQAEADRILHEARQQACEIVSEANEAKEEALAEIKAAQAQLETTKADAQRAADCAIIDAQTRIAGMLATASKDFIALAQNRALKSDANRAISAKKMTPMSFTKAAEKAFVSFDLETTGLNASRCEIIEIGAIKYVNMQKEAEFHSLVKPKRGIPASATAINNITNAMVADAPDIADVLPKFLAFVGDMPLVAHNAEFDIGFLERAMILSDISSEIKYADSLAIARKKFKKLDSYRLEAVGEYLGSNITGLHRSLADCAIVGDIVLSDADDTNDI